MISLIKKISKTEYSIKLRNYLNLKPVKININNISNNHSISDTFFWRTDNNFTTVFKFTDILKQFYLDNSAEVEIILYSKFFKQIKSINISLKDLNNFVIDRNLVESEDFGTFYIFHKSKKSICSIRNSCYTGFFKFENCPTFVHGNLPSIYKKFNNENIEIDKKNFSMIGSSFLKNQVYKIQKNFLNDDKVEVLLNNPTNDILNISINEGNEFYLNPGYSEIINLEKISTVKIQSNCYLLRPIVFNYRKNSFDVFHG